MVNLTRQAFFFLENHCKANYFLLNKIKTLVNLKTKSVI
jgi:hypothetical protein